MYLARLHTVLLESEIVLDIPSSVSEVFVRNGMGHARLLLSCSHLCDTELTNEEVHLIESGIVSLVLDELKDEPVDWENSLVLVRLHSNELPNKLPGNPSTLITDKECPPEGTQEDDFFSRGEEVESPPIPPPFHSKRHENFLCWCGTYFPVANDEVAALLFTESCNLFIRSYAWKNVDRMKVYIPFASQRFCAHLDMHGASGTLFVRALELLLPPIETFILPEYYKEVVEFASKVHGWKVNTLLEIVDAIAHHSDAYMPDGVRILRSMLFV